MNSKLLAEIWQNHSGKISGAAIGLLIGIFIITFGFFRTIFVLLCMIAGYVIGKRIDEKEDIMDILEKLLPPGYHR
ncbi:MULTISPECIES: DUF2273 domain-containing protein [Propionispora]|jgi:uncharacterized membrane protein|uniref:Uncharacterized membrane protein n=2 Tax=Propionispora TaxID=112902 RepID=A0A1H8NFV5_9FIRM|nr:MULTISPECIES: DUF2273 domain-containing protein [Propionispora]SEO28338.1 Uncharacterized membrane protein [Propionispora vibrioides]SHI42213.1 Uncharacterized membrane protein [Propionispora hippei DSM 15287]